MSKSLLPKLINGLWFQAVWFTCVVWKQDGILIGGTLLLLGLLFMRLSAREFVAATLITMGGCLIDSILTGIGMFTFDNLSCRSCIPVWLVLLWAAFSLTLLSSLSYLQNRPGIAALAGAVAAPISYVAASELGAVALNEGALGSSVVLGLIWMMFLPACCQLIARVSGKRISERMEGTI